ALAYRAIRGGPFLSKTSSNGIRAVRATESRDLHHRVSARDTRNSECDSIQWLQRRSSTRSTIPKDMPRTRFEETKQFVMEVVKADEPALWFDVHNKGRKKGLTKTYLY